MANSVNPLKKDKKNIEQKSKFKLHFVHTYFIFVKF